MMPSIGPTLKSSACIFDAPALRDKVKKPINVPSDSKNESKVSASSILKDVSKGNLMTLSIGLLKERQMITHKPRAIAN